MDAGHMKKLLLALAFSLLASSAWAQCSGVFPPNTVCGNNTGSPAPPTAFPTPSGGGGGGGVTSLNALTGTVNITAGSNVAVTPIGQNIQISATGGGGGGGGVSTWRNNIPNIDTGGASFIATGYAGQGDFGSGAPYICFGQNANSVNAIQDNTGRWCAIDVNATKLMGGFRPQWFGAAANGVPIDRAAFQSAIDAAFNTGVFQVYCNGLYAIDQPLFFDYPANLRGGGAWNLHNGSYYYGFGDFNGQAQYPPGAVVSVGTTHYSNSGGGFGLNAFSQPPNSPNTTTLGINLGYRIVNATTAVTYNPTHTNASGDDIAVLPLRGTASIGTPLYLTSSGQQGSVSYSLNGTPNVTNQTAVINSTIVVLVQTLNTPITSVTDSAGHTYTEVTAAHINTLHMFTSINIASALPSGGSITINGGDSVMVAVSVTNANGGVDTPAIRTANFASTTAPTVTSGTLAQAVEIVFGAWAEESASVSNIFTGFAGWTEASLFTSAAPSVWVVADWNSATTYSAGQVIFFQGIPWQSIKNGNINNIPSADLINGPLVNWQPISLTPTKFSENNTLYGPPMLPQAKQSAGNGCVIWAQYNNSAALVMANGNGNTVDSVFVRGQDTDLGCGQPNTGIGIAVIGFGGGANRTSFRNVGVTGMYYDFDIGLNNIQNPAQGSVSLGAENRIDNSNIDEGRYGVYYAGNQAFVNSITNSTIRAIHAVVSNSTLGVHLYNVNMAYEGLSAPRNKFTMAVTGGAATTDSAGILFNATLTLAGDPYMIRSCTDPVDSMSNPVPVHFGHFA